MEKEEETQWVKAEKVEKGDVIMSTKPLTVSGYVSVEAGCVVIPNSRHNSTRAMVGQNILIRKRTK